jgi:uncharacterized membrane protein YkvA (DUF1232 family)
MKLSRYENGFAGQYSAENFRQKLLRYARSAGAEVIERALQLFYALEDPSMPTWAKAVIVGALGYFITPTDAIPDLLPAVGYSDDLGVLVLALATLATRITPAVKDKARQKMRDWLE